MSKRKPLGAERGEYRPFFKALFIGADFRRLSPDARLVFCYLKGTLPSVGIMVWPLLAASLADQMDLETPRVEIALRELEREGWIRHADRVVWIVRGLQFEPNMSPANLNHRAFVQHTLAGLPSCAVVREFRHHYRDWFDEAAPALDVESHDPRLDHGRESPSTPLRDPLPEPSEGDADAIPKASLSHDAGVSDQSISIATPLQSISPTGGALRDKRRTEPSFDLPFDLEDDDTSPAEVVTTPPAGCATVMTPPPTKLVSAKPRRKPSTPSPDTDSPAILSQLIAIWETEVKPIATRAERSAVVSQFQSFIKTPESERPATHPTDRELVEATQLIATVMGMYPDIDKLKEPKYFAGKILSVVERIRFVNANPYQIDKVTATERAIVPRWAIEKYLRARV